MSEVAAKPPDDSDGSDGQYTVRQIASMTDGVIAELQAACNDVALQLSAEMDRIIAECGGTVEQCVSAVKNRIDFRLENLAGQVIECRDGLRSQLYTRMDEYLLRLSHTVPEAVEGIRGPAPGSFTGPTEQKCYFGYCWEFPVSTQHVTMAGCNLADGQYRELDFWLLPGGDVYLIGRDGTLTAVPYRGERFDVADPAIRAFFGLAPVDPATGSYNCNPPNGGNDDAPPICVPDEKLGITCGPTLAGGQCDDSAIRTACERAGGKWFQGRCYFTSPVDTLDGGNGQGGYCPGPGGVITVVDSFGGSCAADCLGDASDPAKMIIRLRGDARVQCGPCADVTFVIRDQRANATDNECQATCVPDESTPGRQVLLLQRGAELYCGPCGKLGDNPVGIEQPQAFRFQQRQSPWFRDAINWSGQDHIDFYNSQSAQAYLDEGERLRRLRNEG